MNNFLYCFDENYNFQAFSSIISLLDNVSAKIDIFIIHKSEENNKFIPNKILLHKNLNKVTVYKFNKETSNFPNVQQSHVSEATYYRLFFQHYIPKNIETILYVDADVICIQDPIKTINLDTANLINSKKVVSAKTEMNKADHNNEIFSRLGMNSSKYFNAGVMNINYQEWKNLNIDYKEKIIEFKDKLDYWDQDLLNHIFDGKYQELDFRLNKVLDLAKYEYEQDNVDTKTLTHDIKFIHFAGSHKPWSVNGIMCNLSEIYQREFRKISLNAYHITHKIRSMSLIHLINNIYNYKFFRLTFKIQFIYCLLKSFFEFKIKKRNI